MFLNNIELEIYYKRDALFLTKEEIYHVCIYISYFFFTHIS